MLLAQTGSTTMSSRLASGRPLRAERLEMYIAASGTDSDFTFCTASRRDWIRTRYCAGYIATRY